MAIDSNLESALAARRADTLSKLGNSARASESQRARKSVDGFVDRAYGAVPERKDKDEPFDPRRGRKLNISV
jgi:hypothetical protein